MSVSRLQYVRDSSAIDELLPNRLEANGPNSTASVLPYRSRRLRQAVADVVERAALDVVPLGMEFVAFAPTPRSSIRSDGVAADDGRPAVIHSPMSRSYSSLLAFVPCGPR